MKRYLLLIVAGIAILLSFKSFAQTNTFPSSGNVGIGTVSPSAALHVTSTDAKIGLLTLTTGIGGNPKLTSTGTSVLMIDGEIGTNIGWDNNTNGTHSVNIGNRLGLTSIAGFYNSSNSEVFRISNSGNVGIGTTSPSNLLTINAPDYPTMPLYITYTGAGKGLSLGWRSIVFPTDDNSNISFTNAGGIYTGELKNLTLCTGNSPSPGNLLIPYGNVGIGTATPQQKLDITGSSRVNNSIIISNSDYSISASSAIGNLQGSPCLYYAYGGGMVYGYNTDGLLFAHATTGNNVGGFFRSALSNSTNGGNAFVIGNNYGGYSPTSGSNTYSSLLINPFINSTGGSNTVRGIYYNPLLTSMTGVTHRAIETVTGDVLLGTASGNVGIGTTSPAERLSVAGNLKLDGKIYWDWGSRTIEQFTESDGVSQLIRFRNSIDCICYYY